MSPLTLSPPAPSWAPCPTCWGSDASLRTATAKVSCQPPARAALASASSSPTSRGVPDGSLSPLLATVTVSPDTLPLRRHVAIAR